MNNTRNDPKIVAIIPARGGSKRIPGKNIRLFHGKPVIAYSIEAAVKSGLFSSVIVSTDSDKIAAIAKDFGAEVPFMRSEKNSDDLATTVDVLSEVLKKLTESDRCYDYACCIYPVAPLINSTMIVEGYRILSSGNHSSLFAGVKFSHPVWRGFRIIDGKPEFAWPELLESRTQDLEDFYHDAGQFYWFGIPEFEKTNTIISNESAVMLLSEEEVQDIDNESDWKMAEAKYKSLYG